MESWRLVVSILQQVLPVFDNFASALYVAGYGYRVDSIQHLLTFGWIVTIPSFIFLTVATAGLSHRDLAPLTGLMSRGQLATLSLVATIAFLAFGYWTMFGFLFVPNNIIFAWQEYNLPLLMIGVVFLCVIIFGVWSQFWFRVVVEQSEQLMECNRRTTLL
jgi:hypothetical protein